MSVITDVVLHVDYAPDEVLAQLEQPFTEHGGRSGAFTESLAKISTEEAGGPKVFTGNLFIGSYNFLDSEELVKWLREMVQGTYTDAVLSMAHESYVEVYLVKQGKLLEAQPF